MTRQFVVDEVARVSAPGRTFQQTRLLIDTDGNAAVFIVSTEAPVLTFTSTQHNRARGSGLDANGGVVQWVKRGSSCQYKLAKCQIKAEILETRWV